MNTLTADLTLLISDYLHKCGSSCWHAEIPSERSYNNIIVVPAIQEYENIRSLLNSLLENDHAYFSGTLILFVVNNTKSASVEVKSNNARSLLFLRDILENQEEELSKRIVNKKFNVGFVDAASYGNELPEKDGGVGLARKIGMDLSLSLFDSKSAAKKIIICLDADCTVEPNYISSIIEIFNKKNLSAAYVQYEHKLPESGKEKLAIIVYEIFLRYYVLGLKYAGSPYAFPTIGSTIVCDAESYLKIGGMNKKKAAEDFYFMEKLAKAAAIEKIDSTKVYPASRISWRVPFGTGQRMNRYLAETHNEYLLYAPKSFTVLKEWIELFHSKEILDGNDYLIRSGSIHSALKNFLLHNSFVESWNKILNNSKSEEQIYKQKKIWFDGFRTLKLIHYLRDSGFPLTSTFHALDEMLKNFNCELHRKNNEDIPAIEIQVEYLNLLRKLA